MRNLDRVKKRSTVFRNEQKTDFFSFTSNRFIGIYIGIYRHIYIRRIFVVSHDLHADPRHTTYVHRFYFENKFVLLSKISQTVSSVFSNIFFQKHRATDKLRIKTECGRLCIMESR